MMAIIGMYFHFAPGFQAQPPQRQPQQQQLQDGYMLEEKTSIEQSFIAGPWARFGRLDPMMGFMTSRIGDLILSKDTESLISVNIVIEAMCGPAAAREFHDWVQSCTNGVFS